MNKISRPLLIALAIVLVVTAVAIGLAVTHEHGGMNGSLMFFYHDLSDSAFGWAIAIPILLVVGVIVTGVCVGAALLTAVALALALVITVFAILLAMTPLAIFLAIPVLAVYGLSKLFQRTSAQTA